MEEEERRLNRVVPAENVFAVKSTNHVKNTRYVQQKENRRANNFKNVKCYSCGMKRHIKCQCRKRSNSTTNFAAVAFNATTTRSANRQWILDSGASAHMCNEKLMFSNMQYVYSAQCDVSNRKERSSNGHWQYYFIFQELLSAELLRNFTRT